MKTWILYKREDFSKDKKINFGVDILQGRLSEDSSKTKRTVAFGKSPADLAKIVVKYSSKISGMKIMRGDWVVSLERIILPIGNHCMYMPTSPEEIREFSEAYKKLTSDA